MKLNKVTMGFFCLLTKSRLLSAASHDWFNDPFQKSKIAYKNSLFCFLDVNAWLYGNAACLTPLHTLTPSVLCVFCRATPFLSPPLSVIHCHAVAHVQPWLSYLCWFMRSLCKIWDRIQTHQGTHIKTTHQCFPTSPIENNMKQTWKQKRMIRCFLS